MSARMLARTKKPVAGEAGENNLRTDPND